MSLEDPYFISQLDPSNPTGTDPKSQGDNHIRVLKRAVQGSFPNLGAVAVTATAIQLNAAATSSGQYSTGTSTTSLLIGTGSKSFTTQAGRGFAVGQIVRITSNANVANYMQGQVTAYDTVTGAMTVNVTTIGGSGTFADWSIAVFLDTRLLISRSPRTANTSIAAADNGTWIDVTANTFTQTFDAVSTLGIGWWCILGNSGTGDVTLDPSGSETIDGLTSYIMYPGEVRLVQCDGTALRTIVWNGYSKTFTTSGIWTKPPGYRSHDGVCDGGGGSGGRYVSGQNSLGGNGGSRAFFSFMSSLLSATEGVTVGTGGASQTVDATPGNTGGLSQFKTAIAYGGQGGINSTQQPGPAAYISGSSNATIIGSSTTTDAYFGGAGAQNAGPTNGRTVYGNGSGASISDAGVLIAAPATIFGSAGGTTNAAGTAATAGTAPGGGGGAARNGNASGAGARGEVKIWGVI